MPPPSLSTSTIVSARPRRLAASSPPRSWASATSPISSATGPSLAAAAPNAAETVPSIPLAPRWASTRGGSARAGHEGLDVAHGHRRGDEQRGVVGEERVSSRATRGSPSRSPSASSMAARRRRVGRGPRSSHAGSPTSDVASSSVAPGRRRARAPASRRGRATRPRVRRRPARRPGRQPGAQRLGRRQVAHAQPPAVAAKRVAAQQRVVVRDRRGAAPRPGQRIRQQRPAGSRREPRERLRQRRLPALGPPGDDHAVRMCRHPLAEVAPAPPERARRASHGAPSGRPPRPVGQVGRRHERLAQREVQVHRAGATAAPQRRVDGAARERAQPRLGRRVVGADLEEPARRRCRRASAGRSPGRRRPRAAPAGRSAVRTSSGTPRLVRLDHGRAGSSPRRSPRCR